MSKTISHTMVFDFGKHKGETFIEVLSKDWGYLAFLEGKNDFHFTTEAKVMSHLVQYLNQKTKFCNSSEFMREMLVAVNMVVDYSDKQKLDANGWKDVKRYVADIFDKLDDPFGYSIPERLASRIAGSESGKFVLGAAFLAMTSEEVSFNKIEPIFYSSTPTRVYDKLVETINFHTTRNSVREEIVKTYVNWGIW